MRIREPNVKDDTSSPLTCAGCGQAIDDDAQPLTLGARLRPGQQESLKPGLASMTFATVERQVPVIVAGPYSQASRNGEDLLFPSCSAECIETIRGILEAEIAAGNDLLGPTMFPDMQ